LLGRVADAQIVLVGKLVAREDHRNTDCREQTHERELDAFFGENDAVVQQKVEETLVSEALDVVAADVVDRLRAIGKADQPAVDRLADPPIEARLLIIVATEDGVAHHALEGLVPQSVEPVLPEEIERYRELFADDQESVVGPPAPQPRPPGQILELLHEIPIG